MYHHSDYRNAVSGLSTASMIETDGPSDAAMARMIRTAREQTHYSDGLKLETFKHWPEFPAARKELFCCLQWLTTLLPGDGEVATVRAAIASKAGELSDPIPPS